MLHGPPSGPCCQCKNAATCAYVGNVAENKRLGTPINMNDGPQGFRDNNSPGSTTATHTPSPPSRPGCIPEAEPSRCLITAWPSGLTMAASWDEKRCSSGALVGSTSTMRLCFANDNAFGATHLHKAPLLCPPRCFVRHGCRVPCKAPMSNSARASTSPAPEGPQFRIPLRRGPLPATAWCSRRSRYASWPHSMGVPDPASLLLRIQSKVSSPTPSTTSSITKRPTGTTSRSSRTAAPVGRWIRLSSGLWVPKPRVSGNPHRRRGGWGWKRHVQLQPNQRHLVV